ncbi:MULTISPECIES: nicotinate phosphoribosyltransferase [unclassified Amycolatopsis]|uniref:nicotinate phosphoribosyltransferase n=1 Tax=unclassified Amycolatopsis TaxID=2618356 RepID=UPI001C6A76DC|nr:nicotinate phosphoribosyltransferase [Amycolatopsis sp. DSM 110486]QYN20312.1 nicotinate phosphoribosyltransferase [Amycolatopsis sp. DSM 110486]
MNALRTDLYEIRMAASYLRRGMTAPATFSLFVRDLPRDRGFLIAAGLAECLDLLRDEPEELAYVGQELGFPATDVEALSRLRFTGDVRAVPEGRAVFAGEPLLEVTAPLPEAQLVETMLLNSVTFATAVATKAARCRLAAPRAELVDFSARRAHGGDAALAAARLTALAGFSRTSNVEGAARYGLRAAGTVAHSYIQAFRSEPDAFRAFVEDFPAAPVLLVDTYDPVTGIARAIEVFREFGVQPAAAGVRLDSGDLLALSEIARKMLDEAGFRAARIMASGGLDEYELERLTSAEAPIDVYGLGTAVGVSADAPTLDTAYKLVGYDGRPVVKLSTGKRTLPGAKQVYRGAAGEPDVLATTGEPPCSGRDVLLLPVMLGGRSLGQPSVSGSRRRCEHDLAWLPPPARRLRRPEPVGVVHSTALASLAADVAGRVGEDHEHAAPVAR